MSPWSHLMVSLAVGAGVGWALDSPPAAAACLAGGVLIDVDHIPDYFHNYGGRPGLRHFFRVFKQDVVERIFVLLHAWELIFLLAVGVWLTGWQPLGIGFLTGAVLHLGLDQLFNDHHPLAYFLVYRMRHGFAGRYFYGRREYRERLKQMRGKSDCPGRGT